MYATKTSRPGPRPPAQKSTGLPISGNPLWSSGYSGHRIAAPFRRPPGLMTSRSGSAARLPRPCGHSAQGPSQQLNMALAGIDEIDSHSARSSHLDDLAHRLERVGASTRSHTPQATKDIRSNHDHLRPHRDTVESFVDSMHGGADKDALSGILAEDVVMYGHSAMSHSPAARQSWKPCEGSARWRPTSPTRKSSAERRTTPRTSGCKSKTPWSTEWTTSCSTRTARSPR